MVALAALSPVRTEVAAARTALAEMTQQRDQLLALVGSLRARTAMCSTCNSCVRLIDSTLAAVAAGANSSPPQRRAVSFQENSPAAADGVGDEDECTECISTAQAAAPAPTVDHVAPPTSPAVAPPAMPSPPASPPPRAAAVDDAPPPEPSPPAVAAAAAKPVVAKTPTAKTPKKTPGSTRRRAVIDDDDDDDDAAAAAATSRACRRRAACGGR